MAISYHYYFNFVAHREEYIPIYHPTKRILNPLEELPYWIPAPIPIYTPAPVYNYVQMNDLVSVHAECLNSSNPEIPTMINMLKNAVVFKTGKIITANFYYLSFVEDKDIDTRNFEVIDQAVPFFHDYLTCYYHFLIEQFPLVLCFGQEILRNSVLLHNRFMKKQFNDLLSILNLSFKRSLIVGTPVLVKRLYISNPHPFIEFNANALRHLRYLLITKCNATNLKATQYVYYNRKKNRLILNFAEMQKELEKELPNITFIQPTFESMSAQIIFWRKTKFVMMIHGSTFSNYLFMHPNTAYLEFCIKACRSAAYKMCKALGVRVYEIMFQNHCLNRSMWADIPVLIPAVKKILKDLEKENLDLF